MKILMALTLCLILISTIQLSAMAETKNENFIPVSTSNNFTMAQQEGFAYIRTAESASTNSINMNSDAPTLIVFSITLTIFFIFINFNVLAFKKHKFE